MKSILFAITMGVASVLATLKIIVVAELVSPEQFGLFISYLSFAFFLGVGVSLGLVEGTVKLYPRLWAAGENQKLFLHSSHIFSILLSRYVVVLSIGLLCSWLFNLASFLVVISVTGVALGVTFFSITSSYMRAREAFYSLAWMNVFRNVFGILLVISMAYWFGTSQAMIAAELLSVLLLVGALLWIYLPKKMVTISKPVTPAFYSMEDRKQERYLYLSNMINLSPLYLDKVLITAIASPVVTAKYAIAMLVVQVFTLITNTVSQLYGTKVVKLGNSKEELQLKIVLTAKWVSFIAVLCVLTFIVFVISKEFDAIKAFFDKYEVSTELFLIAVLIAFLRVSVLFEFLLLSKEKEKKILEASILSSVVFFGGFGIAAVVGFTVEQFMLVVLASKLLQVAALALRVKHAAF